MSMGNREQRTYQARPPYTTEADSILSAYASVYGKAERTLLARLQSDGDLTTLKRDFLPRFGITARQFNSLAAELKGKINSIKERQSGLIRELEQRIAKAKRVLKRIADPARKHQKQRRIVMLQERLGKMKADRKADKVRLCFGSRKLFRSQFHLKENGYASHSEWLSDWQSTRSNQFFVIGSKDETAGNQSCVVTVAEDGSISLRLRLPDALSEYGKYLVIGGLRFEHGHEAIIAAIGRNLSGSKEDRQAFNYRFLKDDKGWRVFVSMSLPEGKLISLKDTGVIGIDINADNIAVTETDRFGNPTEYFAIPCVTYGKTVHQRKAVIGDAIKQIIAFAILRRKPIVIEKLDFQKKKAALERQAAKYARILSALAYTQIQTMIRARAYDAGIEVCEVNPAYSSVIGQYKFKDRYGMSTHNAAALVIGRRSLDFGESLPSQLQGTLPLSVRNRGGHVWSQWAVVSRKVSAARAARRRSAIPDKRESRSSLSPAPSGQGTACDPAALAGEIPACESSVELFG